MKRFYKSLYVVFCIFFLNFSFTFAFAKDVISYPWAEKNDFSYDSYYKALLHLALDKSKDVYGDYEINEIDAGVSQDHMVRLVQKNKFVNLFWTMTSKEREQKLLPIRFPLFKGLLGCRVFFIKKGQQTKFDQLKSAEQLKSFIVGQGKDWPDTQILLDNNFNVVTSLEHESLFKMLTKGRFDFFPRAIHEARSEIIDYPDIVIEKRFLLYYDSPFFFFVNKDNSRLAERLKYGLNASLEDGSFERFFNNHPVSSDILNQFSLNTRELLFLKNPSLTTKTQQALYQLKTHENCLIKAK